jgi:hypothetical protein
MIFMMFSLEFMRVPAQRRNVARSRRAVNVDARDTARIERISAMLVGSRKNAQAIMISLRQGAAFAGIG